MVSAQGGFHVNTNVPPTDLINFKGLLSEDERAVAERVRAFVQREIKPNVGRWFENAELPTEIFSKLASEGLFGMHLKGYGCAGLSAPQYGLAMQELEAGDSGICSVFVGLRHYWRRRGCRWG
ncbi:acyl-CoA dehydrogenase family protein [Corynebacterium argentoratense]|uniref:acyl-CoA dehydrogenase family protein n=1 Tax=Corynebacterium argentoratense TaxID=42817 RepID=UPI00398C7158